MLILLYHGVRPVDDRISPDIRVKHVPEQAFRQQLNFLRRTHRFYSLTEVVRLIKEQKPLPALGACITFDDGYANNAEVAAPILSSLGISATFFVTTGFIDQKTMLWVDRFESTFSQLQGNSLSLKVQGEELHVSLLPGDRTNSDARIRERLKKCSPEVREQTLQELESRIGNKPNFPLHRPMSWDQIRSLRQQGFEIGAHTVTHPILSQCSTEVARAEIFDSKKRIEEELGSSCIHFAHPNGQPPDWNDSVMNLIREAGFHSCSTTIGRKTGRTEDPFSLPRLTVDMGTDFSKFVLTISGLRSMLRRFRR